MTLWILPFIGDPIEIPFSPPDSPLSGAWRPIYHYLYAILPFVKGKQLHQLRLIHNGSFDLSGVKEGDVLHLLVTEPMVEQWISEYTLSSPSSSNPLFYFHHSMITWMDGRWGDPYEHPEIQYRTPLTLHILKRESIVEGGRSDYQINPNYFKELYPSSPSPEPEWYPTLSEALRAFQTPKGEVMTDKTIDHMVHLFELYHGTNEHLARQGRAYE